MLGNICPTTLNLRDVATSLSLQRRESLKTISTWSALYHDLACRNRTQHRGTHLRNRKKGALCASGRQPCGRVGGKSTVGRAAIYNRQRHNKIISGSPIIDYCEEKENKRSLLLIRKWRSSTQLRRSGRTRMERLTARFYFADRLAISQERRLANLGRPNNTSEH
ncbi:hypothetical protein EVAR_33997_1 [Eumeta japonica]|uniref:Uncharacterized protein n=1 Tax=Eumeta variegata TaxID=151549 RepID=A0A4C1X1I9_EUMVA|nr:hypothetical protein EVAR_33997_1 [Eumeta japonica]